MRRSYASVAKEDRLASSLPTSVDSDHMTALDLPADEQDCLQKTCSAEEIALPINIQPGSILARTRNRLYQAALATASAVISPPPTVSKSCSPPQPGRRMLLHAASMQALSSVPHQTMTSSHHQQQYVYEKPANSPPPNQMQPRQTGTSYDKRIVLYKTEMCRTLDETGICRYGVKCQFAHDRSELRQVARHPRYKTEICKTYWQLGTCPYGKRCCFIHSESELASMTTSNTSNSPINTHNILSTIPRSAFNNHSISEDDFNPADEADMESMMENLPTDMLSML